MKRQNILPIACISLLVIVFISNILATRRAGPPPSAVQTPAPTARQMGRYYSEGEIIDAMEKNLEQLFPGSWDLSRYLVENHTVVDVRIYSDTVAAARDTAAAGLGDMPEKWDGLVESTRAASESWARTFTLNRIDGVMVQMGQYDSADPETPCFVCVNGITVLDLVHGVDLFGDVLSMMEEAAQDGA